MTAIRIHSFLTVMEKDRIYDAHETDVASLKHSAWLSNHWDDLINEQNRFQERGAFIATELSPDNVEFKLEWLPLRNMTDIASEYIREKLLLKVRDMDIRDEFVVYFTNPGSGLDMCYHIPLSRYIN